ncbi:MAG: DnaJ domain-containing protein [Gammaproteobacteria bacterium]|nr:DnaJ domain-containing protein [Gammaproteobacteria bacterium]
METSDNHSNTTQQASLFDLIMDALLKHSQGLSEYQLIQHIKSSGYLQFQNIRLWNHLSLFQTHFILFNALYHLRDKLWQEKTGTLEICPVNIVLLPYKPTSSASMTEHDPLRAYYLNLDNLKKTNEQDVATLLQNIWLKLENNERRQAALNVLELQDPVDYAAIKMQHRRLAMRHHPDRGGDNYRLQTINAAMKILKKTSTP